MSRADVSFAPEGNLLEISRALIGKLLRHKLLFVTVAAAIALAGICVTLSIRPRYVAQATIAVLPDTADPMSPTGADSQSLRDEEVGTQARLITSMDLARTVMLGTGYATTPPPSFLARWPVIERVVCARNVTRLLLERLCTAGRVPDLQSRVSQFLGALTASPVARTRLIELSLTGSDPALVASTLNRLVEVYQEQQIARRTVDLDRTAHWVSSRADELRQNWLNAERRAGEFRAGNGLLPTGGEAGSAPLVVQQISQAASALATAQSEIAQARARLGELSASSSSQDKLASVKLSDEPALVSLANQLSVLRAQRASLSGSQGDQSPTLIGIDRQIGAVNRQIATEQAGALGRLSADVRTKASQVSAAERVLAQLRSGAGDVTEKSVFLNTLDDEAKGARAVFELFLARAHQLDDKTQLLRPQVELASHAVVPVNPAFPNIPNFLAGSVVFGLLGGSVAALMREGLKSGFSDIGQVAGRVGLPLICCIPLVRSRRERRSLLGFGSRTTFSAVTEAMRTLAAHLALSTNGPIPRSVAIVSATSQEGKTTTALWLAASIARSGRRVLLLDGDHRRGAIGIHLGDTSGQGVSDIIFDEAPILGCIKRERGGAFDFISAGRPTARPFGSEEIARMRETIKSLRAEYDLVVIDTPPMLALPDVLLYANAVDTTILLCRWQSTAPRAVVNCAQRLADCGARVLGVVLSMVDHDRLAQFSEEYSAHDMRMLKRFYITD